MPSTSKAIAAATGLTGRNRMPLPHRTPGRSAGCPDHMTAPISCHLAGAEEALGVRLPLLHAEAEHGFEVVCGKLLKRDHGLRSLDAFEPREPLRHDAGELVVLAHADDGDKVPFPGNRVDLGHARHVSEPRTEVRQRLTGGLHENHGRQHLRIMRLVTCQGMPLDRLQTRSRFLALFERYGALLTEHQRSVLDLHLRSDWSLAEI